MAAAGPAPCRTARRFGSVGSQSWAWWLLGRGGLPASWQRWGLGKGDWRAGGCAHSVTTPACTPFKCENLGGPGRNAEIGRATVVPLPNLCLELGLQVNWDSVWSALPLGMAPALQGGVYCLRLGPPAAGVAPGTRGQAVLPTQLQRKKNTSKLGSRKSLGKRRRGSDPISKQGMRESINGQAGRSHAAARSSRPRATSTKPPDLPAAAPLRRSAAFGIISGRSRARPWQGATRSARRPWCAASVTIWGCH